jgi:hypothetical protein
MTIMKFLRAAYKTWKHERRGRKIGRETPIFLKPDPVSSAALIWPALACLAVCGCGRSSAKAPQIQTMPVKGTVTLDGKPLAGADVTFIAGAPPTTFAGRTKEDGTYELQGLAGRETSLSGSCKVTVSRLVKRDGLPLAADETPADAAAVEQLPPKYSRYDATTLTANVVSSGGAFDFALTSR